MGLGLRNTRRANRQAPTPPSARRRCAAQARAVACCTTLLLLLWVLAGCGATSTPAPASATGLVPEPAAPPVSQAPASSGASGKGAVVSLSLASKEIDLEPLPLRAGFPFTITIPIHNNNPVPAVGVPVMIYLSAKQEQIGFGSFFQVLTATVPATQTLAVQVPVAYNLAGGEYQLWVQVNRLSAPIAQQTGLLTQPEANIDDNAALLDIVVAPFDAYVSDLCAGRVDVALEFAEIWIESDLRRLHLRVHNLGNQAVYNLAVVATGRREDLSEQVSGVAYTPAIPPCGGTGEAVVDLNRPLEAGELLDVAVNPEEWPDKLAEDSFNNNYVRSVTLSSDSLAAGQNPLLLCVDEQGTVVPGGSPPLSSAAGATDYDFAISPVDVEIVRSGIILVKVYNLGTRDAANVPVRIEGKAGRKVTDVIPLVKGNGLGVAAIQLGWVWYPKAELTLTVNPEGAKGAYPETDRDNNVVTFTLP